MVTWLGVTALEEVKRRETEQNSLSLFIAYPPIQNRHDESHDVGKKANSQMWFGGSFGT
jgi:hypothetical protein